MDNPAKAADEIFCSSCGNVVKVAAEICPKCGVRISKKKNGRERIVYLLLGIFLGSLGAHNFYAGYSGRAIAQLLISILSCGMLAIPVQIWAIIEACTTKVDAEGIPFVN